MISTGWFRITLSITSLCHFLIMIFGLRFWICIKANCKMDWTTEQDGNREKLGKRVCQFYTLFGTYVCSYTTDDTHVYERDDQRLWQD